MSLPLSLKNESCLNKIDIEELFKIFKNDFISNQAIFTLDEIDYIITVKELVTCNCPYGGKDKPERFWHIISKKELEQKKQNNPCRNDREKSRAYCPARAKRIHWIKETIDGFIKGEEHIKYFMEDKGSITHFLWDTKRFYIVLIKQLGKSGTLLVTAYPVYKNKYRDYRARLRKYEKKS